MKKIVLTILLLTTLSFSRQHEINLYNFADAVAVHNNAQILISGDIELNSFYFYTKDNEPLPSLEVFKKMLELKGLKLLTSKKGFYFVYDPYRSKQEKEYIDFEDYLKGGNSVGFKSYVEDDITKDKLRYVKLKNNSYLEISDILSNLDKNATYISKDNAVSFLANDEIYSQILEAINSLDEKKLDQITFKITILETDLNNARNLGTELNSLLKVIDRNDLSFFANLISAPYNLTTNVIRSKKDKFYGVLNFLDTNNISKIKSSPFLTAKSNTSVYFSVVENIPYLITNSKYTQSGTSSQNSYEYRDIGLKLSIKPVIFDDYVDFDLIGRTRDDACGEAFDKVARSMGLAYPGGPIIDKLAAKGNPSIEFPRVMLEEDSYDFSFSGLKTAVINYLHHQEQVGGEVIIEYVARSFQDAVIDVLEEKSFRLLKEENLDKLVLAGGVSANSGLRKRLEERAKKEGVKIYYPELKLCTDNAAMIGSAGYYLYKSGKYDQNTYANPNLAL